MLHNPAHLRSRRRLRTGLACIALTGLLLAGCGGGGSSAGDTPPANNPPLPAVNVSPVAAADPGSALPAGWERGPFMQIFVRSYQDSDGDGIGDLRGLVSRLDYLKDLGVRGLWLMPITRSQDRDHGYAVTDYRDIEPAYGSLADLDELLRQAHARGIGVILDYVINHSAAEHPLFVNSRSASSNTYRDWYVWQANMPAGWSVFGGNPWRSSTTGAYYAPFWDQMPDFNLTNPAVVAHHQDNLRFWLNRGVDGFRFDAVGLLIENGSTAWENQPQSRALMNTLRGTVASYSRRTIVCEAPGDSQAFAASSACGSAFAFDLKDALIGAARGQTSALRSVADYFLSAPGSMATLLANHDSFAGARLWDQFNGDVARYRLAAASLLLLPGIPFVYYGEEIGMAGASGLTGDPRLRTPMSWTAERSRAGFTTGTPHRELSANVAAQNVAAQLATPDSLLNFYRALMTLRNARPELSGGSYEAPLVSGSVLAFQRASGSSRSLVLINYGASAVTVEVGALPASTALPALFPAGSASAASNSGGNARLNLPALSVQVYQVGS